MDQFIEIEHSGVKVRYDEESNRWLFSLRGRDRSSETLKNAKATIDKPVSEKTKPFEHIPVWYFQYGGNEPVKAEVVGLAEARRCRVGQEVWIVKGGTRSKTRTEDSVFPQSKENDAIAAKLDELRRQSEAITKQRNSLRASMTRFEPIPEE